MKHAAGFRAYCTKTGATICGRRPIEVLLDVLPRGAAGKIVAYYTSGDLSGDHSSSVSYAAVVFCSGPESRSKMEDKSMEEEKSYLTEAEEKVLLDIATRTVRCVVRGERLTQPR